MPPRLDDYDDDPLIENPFGDPSEQALRAMTRERPAEASVTHAEPPRERPRRVRQRLSADDLAALDDEDGGPQRFWTARRVALIFITLLLLVSLIALDLMPVLTQFWQSFPEDFFRRPTPTFLPGA
jgi:hypothetical protein